MTTTQIESLFNEAIQEKAIYNKLEGITRNTVFNWLNKRSVPTVGDMLNVLYQLDKIIITKRTSSWVDIGKELNKISYDLHGTNAIIGSVSKEYVEDKNGKLKALIPRQAGSAFPEAGRYTHTFSIPTNASNSELPEMSEDMRNKLLNLKSKIVNPKS